MHACGSFVEAVISLTEAVVIVLPNHHHTHTHTHTDNDVLTYS